MWRMLKALGRIVVVLLLCFAAVTYSWTFPPEGRLDDPAANRR